MLGRTSRRTWFTCTLIVLIALQAVSPAWAWGRLGHLVISRLAEQQLTLNSNAAGES
jgi:hypothetical protein